jgi:hypothetical protein
MRQGATGIGRVFCWCYDENVHVIFLDHILNSDISAEKPTFQKFKPYLHKSKIDATPTMSFIDFTKCGSRCFCNISTLEYSDQLVTVRMS